MLSLSEEFNGAPKQMGVRTRGELRQRLDPSWESLSDGHRIRESRRKAFDCAADEYGIGA